MSSDGQTRTTLTGNAIPSHQHDSLTNVIVGDGHFVAAGAVGANLLPHGSTDNSLVRIPIKNADLEDPSEPPIKLEPPKKKSFMHRLSDAVTDRGGSEVNYRVVMMSRGDYLKYWAKDEHGQFRPSVEVPPEGRRAWVENQLQLNAQWLRDNPKLNLKDSRISGLGGLGTIGGSGY